MMIETKLLLIGLGVIAAMLVLGVTRVLGAWSEHHIVRHDLVRASKSKRLAYFRSLAERDRQEMEALEADSISSLVDEYASVEVIDDEAQATPQAGHEPAMAA